MKLPSRLTSRQSVGLVFSSLLGCTALLFGVSWIKSEITEDMDLARQKQQQDETNDASPVMMDRRQLGEGRNLDGQDLLEPSNMLQRLKEKRQQWLDNQLKKDYGEDHYKNLFFYNDANGKRTSAGYKGLFKDPNSLPLNKYQQDKNAPPKTDFPGWDRMVRKYQMKILQIQLGVIEERITGKDASRLRTRKRRNLANNNNNEETLAEGTYTKFNWVTAGHSSSAAHGNLYRESYTAILDRTLKPILQHIGLDFSARAYSMGGFDSGDELALCMNSVYGRDVDSFFWDFALTDSSNSLWKIILFSYRAAKISQITDSVSQPGNIPRRPSMFAFNQNSERNLVLQGMQALGMTTLAYDDEYFNEVVKPAVPEMMGLSDAEIQQIPRLVRTFKCEGRLESGDPGCKDDKWNETVCPDRRGRVSWHPGWKYHALIGNLIVTTVLDLWEEAIEGVMKQSPANSQESMIMKKERITQELQKLNREEEKEYNAIFDAPVPDSFIPHLQKWWKEGRDEHLDDVSVDSFLKEAGFCHTAVLPSEMRLKGLVTENATSSGNPVDPDTFEQGVSSELIQSVETSTPQKPNENPKAFVDPRPGRANQMLMVKNDVDRWGCKGGDEDEDEIVHIDYKDYFFVSSLQGKRTITIPNEKEKAYYTEYNPKKGKMVVACLTRCDWGTCAKYDFHNYFGWTWKVDERKKKHQLVGAELESMGQLEIKINGEKVTEASDMHTCFALKNIGGHIWFPNANGQYKIEMTIKDASAYSYVRFTSFVLIDGQ
ncbi:expressed unknown protein [Seminavis robusta]|uniref:Uncharacterized protein n=1 Tax=Seminavis robusta TaxID=568900 RepID=A0A9N8HCC2_9STRA|nr:expressed unknown protein [Seminavis robusta]|eukprot:Sro375_g129550.1 n/a (771) ;mRNA; f:60939-63832